MIEVFKLIVDFGILVLIWLVQLVIYPGFLHYSTQDLLKWHGKYTVGISIIVAPLMLAQLLLHGTDSYLDLNPLNVATLLLVIATWIMTFGWAMPLHSKINDGEQVVENVQKLVSMNKYRTLTWTLIFLISLIQWILELN